MLYIVLYALLDYIFDTLLDTLVHTLVYDFIFNLIYGFLYQVISAGYNNYHTLQYLWCNTGVIKSYRLASIVIR